MSPKQPAIGARRNEEEEEEGENEQGAFFLSFFNSAWNLKAYISVVLYIV